MILNIRYLFIIVYVLVGIGGCMLYGCGCGDLYVGLDCLYVGCVCGLNIILGVCCFFFVKS